MFEPITQESVFLDFSLEETQKLVFLAISDTDNDRFTRLPFRDRKAPRLTALEIIKKLPQGHVKKIINLRFKRCFPLLSAAEQGDVDLVNYFLDIPETQVNIVSHLSHPQKPLLISLFWSHADRESLYLLVKRLIEDKKVDINASCGAPADRMTPLSEAIRTSFSRGSHVRSKIIDLILQHAPSALSLDLGLYHAICGKDFDIIKKLIANKAVLTDRHIASAKSYFNNKPEILNYFKGLKPLAFQDEKPPAPQETKPQDSKKEPTVVPALLSKQKQQLIELIEEVDKGSRCFFFCWRRRDPTKEALLEELRLKVMGVADTEIDSEKALKTAAKNVIMLSLQRTRFGFTNTSKSGLKIRELLNLREYGELKNLLFPPDPNPQIPSKPVTYEGLRRLIVHDNLPKVFSSCHAERMWALFRKPKTNGLVSEEAMKKALVPTVGE